MKYPLETEADCMYYSAFVDSILSLPGPIRGFVLAIGNLHTKDGNCYNYLYDLYQDNDGFIHGLLDEYNLAID